MTTLTKAALISEYMQNVDSETGVPAATVEIADVQKEFDSFNQAANWLTKYYLPRWSELDGTAPTVFKVIHVVDKANYTTANMLIEIVGGVASPYNLP